MDGEKHLSLNEAINGIKCLEESAKHLLIQIKGESVQQTDDVAKEGLPSLQDILDNGPERIRIYCDKAHKVIEEIHTALFINTKSGGTDVS